MSAKKAPAQVANEYEMLAQEEIDSGDREAAALYMEPAHAIRRALNALHRLNQRVYSNYDFNADPDGMTLEVGEVLKDYTTPSCDRADCPASPVTQAATLLAGIVAPEPKPEQLYVCPCCRTPGFTAAGLHRHQCQGKAGRAKLTLVEIAAARPMPAPVRGT